MAGRPGGDRTPSLGNEKRSGGSRGCGKAELLWMANARVGRLAQ